jgi:hypothetical protein
MGMDIVAPTSRSIPIPLFVTVGMDMKLDMEALRVRCWTWSRSGSANDTDPGGWVYTGAPIHRQTDKQKKTTIDGRWGE